ncbi:hypothetical protein GYA37_00720 [candidate division WWE3 bacterium]|uniref:Uncharacterized protein n=1 Tax=candidate division WWE3 bacterium TaxID=2053526 RepID=A0A7X9E6F5_UNCKA|nr:hypothetical protein [candidate division WWE3 bacterium]
MEEEVVSLEAGHLYLKKDGADTRWELITPSKPIAFLKDVKSFEGIELLTVFAFSTISSHGPFSHRVEIEKGDIFVRANAEHIKYIFRNWETPAERGRESLSIEQWIYKVISIDCLKGPMINELLRIAKKFTEGLFLL